MVCCAQECPLNPSAIPDAEVVVTEAPTISQNLIVAHEMPGRNK
jgi:hypothetical protein